MRSDHKTNIKYEFLDPKNPRKYMLISTLGQTIEKPIIKMVGGGHFGFWTPAELAHTFARVTPAIFSN